MTAGLGVLLLVLAGLRSLRWWGRRRDVLGRTTAFPAITVGVCLILSVGAFGLVLTHGRTERRLSRAASLVAGVPLTVHCQSLAKASVDLGPELGLVRFKPDGVPEHQTLIKWNTCRRLSAWLRSPAGNAPLEEVIAVHVLTHETMHMAGSTDEAVTECRAMQRDVLMARTLGASAASAHDLAVRYWHDVYPRMPDAYRTEECIHDGALDEHRPTAPWS